MKKETIREKLNRIDHMCIDNDLIFYDLRSMLEAVAPKLSPQDKEEVKKVIQSTDDPETIAAVLAVKSETNEDYDDLDDDMLNEYKDEQISITNKTSRSNGASALNKDGSIRSVVGKFDGVTAYDFGVNVKDGIHDPDALSKTYDVVNVITEKFNIKMLEPLKDIVIDIIDYFDSTSVDVPNWVPGVDSWDELRDKVETNSNFAINIIGNILDFMEYNYLNEGFNDETGYELYNELINECNYINENYSEDDAAKNGRDIGSAVGSVLGTIAPGLDKDVMTAATGATGELMARSSYRKNYNK